MEFQFRNGYTASVIPDGDKEFEISVLHNGEIDYSTPITDDVVRHLSGGEVVCYLNYIESLPPKANPIRRFAVSATVYVNASSEDHAIDLTRAFFSLGKKHLDDTTLEAVVRPFVNNSARVIGDAL